MKKRDWKEELRPYPDSAREDADGPEEKREEESAPGPGPRPMMLVYAGPAFFSEKAAALNEAAEQKQNDLLMQGVYAGPGFFEKRSGGETEEDREEITNSGPAYNQEMPEYVPPDEAAPLPEEKKTQEGLQFFCPSCGNKLMLGLKFCPECGASLKALWAEADENIRDESEMVRGSGVDASAAGGSGDIDGDSVNV